jgi:hypothetical protein
MNKSEFIRSQPVDLPVAEVIALAKAQKMKIASGLVYGVRSALKADKNHVAVTRKAANGNGHHIADKTRAEVLLMALAAEIGLGKSIDLLSAQRATVLGLIEK